VKPRIETFKDLGIPTMTNTTQLNSSATSIDLNKLEALARAATPGPYFVVNHPDGAWTIQTRETGVGLCIAQKYADATRETADFIAAADPAVIRALIDLARRATAPQAAKVASHEDTTTDQAGQWVRCTPNLILAGVDCAKTPRRDGDGTHSHDHFISHASPASTTVSASGEPIYMVKRAKHGGGWVDATKEQYGAAADWNRRIVYRASALVNESEQPSRGAAVPQIKKWEERKAEFEKDGAKWYSDEQYRDAEIADLRAALIATGANLHTAVREAWRANAKASALAGREAAPVGKAADDAMWNLLEFYQHDAKGRVVIEECREAVRAALADRVTAPLPSFSVSRFSDTKQRGVLVIFERPISDDEVEAVRAALAQYNGGSNE
jgi:hypothetical protein